MSVRLKVNESAVKQGLKRLTEKGLKRGTVFYHAQCRRAVSRSNTGVSVPIQRRSKGGNKTSRTIYPDPSKPGEPPKVRSGHGKANIIFGFSATELKSRVGVKKNNLYMIYLDLGTRSIKRRPWLTATLKKFAKQIGRLLASGK